MPPSARRSPFIFALATALAVVAAPLRAQDAASAPLPAPSTPAPAPDPLAEAKDLFRKGVTLFAAGDVERALDYFRRSRSLFPSKQNTLNVAICLDRLERSDEALEAYEDVIASYGAQLNDEERATLPGVMATLRGKLGALDVDANTSGAVVVDGRERGKLPLGAAVRVVPGAHVVRVLKDGYKSFETHVDVARGAVVKVSARLEPLSAAGGLRVEDPALPGADVTVDGVRVGVAPWEGTLAPGSHVVSSHKDASGSAPTQAIVLQGQTALLRLRSAPLGPTAHVVTTPRTAVIGLNGVPLGHGEWEGRLPAGDYQVEATEDGYFARRVALSIPASGDATPPIALVLEVDRAHPRWPSVSGHVWLGAMAAAGVSWSLHSGAEGRCVAACDKSIPTALLVGLRAGWELPSRLSIEIDGGYFAAHAALSRRLATRFPRDTQQYEADYDLHDDVQLRGYFVGPGVSYRAPLASSAWHLRTRLVSGVLFARSVDPVTGTATSGGASVDAYIAGASDEVSTTAPFVLVDLAAERTWGSFRVGLGLSLFAVPFGSAPAFGHTSIRPSAAAIATCADANPGSIGCAQESNVVQGERAYAPFLVVAPQLTVTWLP